MAQWQFVKLGGDQRESKFPTAVTSAVTSIGRNFHQLAHCPQTLWDIFAK
jgi:hypothetical protein